MFRLADRGGCRHRALLAHFGEEIGDCGESCDECTGVSVTELVAASGSSMRAGTARGSRGAGTAGGTKKARGTGAASSGEPPHADRSPSDPTFQRLRTLRKRLADERGVPAYIVFSDQVLWDLIDLRPETRAEMLEVSGVGPAKLDQYGDAFLEALLAPDQGQAEY